MKKTISTLLLGGVVLASVGTVTSALAEDQTITGKTGASVEFVGQIGQFDPETTDPEGPGVPGPGDEGWIKVKLPTSVAYYSTGSSDHKDIVSATSQISNRSAYPVKVSLSGFTSADGSAASADFISSLNLNAGSTTVNLINGGNAVFNGPEVLFSLGANPNSETPQDTTGLSHEGTFDITGTTDESDILQEELQTVENKLQLTFKALDADGNEVPAP
jgi:hypothetical protein